MKRRGKPIHSLILYLQKLIYRSGCYIGYILLLLLNLRISNDIIDYIIDINLLVDGASNHAEVIDELLEVLPHLAFREDWMKGPKIISRQGLHHGKGHCGPSENSMADDFSDVVGNVR